MGFRNIGERLALAHDRSYRAAENQIEQLARARFQIPAGFDGVGEERPSQEERSPGQERERT